MTKQAKIEGVITIKNGTFTVIVARDEKCGHWVVYNIKESGSDDLLALFNKEDEQGKIS